MAIFGFLFLLIPCSSFQLRAQTFPNYNWLRKVDLPTVSGSSLNTEDITIAIAQDRSGNIYTLSVGSGIDKRDPEGNLLQKALIPGGALDSPRDLVIDDEGFIYVADYLASGGSFTDDGKIRVFDPSGNYLPEKTFFTSFYRPLGLDISGDKVYVAEYYDGLQGPEQGSTFSRVRIYEKNSGSLLKESRQVDIPLRIAVNSRGQVYVSQAGAANPAVRIFDGNLILTGQLPNITSPGSVIVDELDYIHVIEYGNRIKFSEFINFDNLSIFDISSLAQDISTGVKNEEFFLKIFNPDGSFGDNLKTQLDFPVDVSQKGCGDLFVNNSEIFDGSFWGMYLPSKLEFDLEVYERTPSIDAAEEPFISCPADMEVHLAAGATSAVVTFSDPSATDRCGVTVYQSGGLASGSNFPLGANEVEFTAEDVAGNKVTCSFAILVLGDNIDEEPPEIQCPGSFSVSANSEDCTALAQYEFPVVTDNSGEVTVSLVEGPEIGEVLRVGETVVKYRATDAAGNTATCEFQIRVIDDTPPIIENCPGDQQEVVSAEGLVVPDYTENLVINDCSGNMIITQLPAAGSVITESVLVTLIAEDDSGNRSADCSFELLLTPEEVVEITSCPANRVLEPGVGCEAVLPDLTTEVSTNISATVVQEPAPGTPISQDTTVRFTATDANGNTDTCEVNITVEDARAPEISCPGNQEFSFDPENGFVVPDFWSESEATDNCNFELFQDPAAGTTIYSSGMVRITAVDNSGNESSCEFELNLIEEVTEVVEITSCPATRVLEPGVGCEAVLPDLTEEVSTNISATVVQEPAPGTAISEDTTVRFTATDANGNTDICEVNITVEDTQVPEISCPGNKEFSFDPESGFIVPDFRNESEADDNCNFELLQDPAAGTTIYSGQTILISVVDNSGNESSCEFELNLIEEVTEVVEITSCANSQVLDLTANCQAVLPDLTSEISTNISATVVQEPAPGTAISEDTTVRFTATDANGNTDTCEVNITVEDTRAPEISCPGNKEFSFDPENGFVVPDFRRETEATDNCNFELLQDPAAGTTIYSAQTILISVVDNSGNESSCEFELHLIEEVTEVVEITSCPANRVLELGVGCEAVLPDLTSEISMNISATVVQEPAPGTAIYEYTTVRFTATDANDNTDTCEVNITVEDTQAPEISCPGNQEFSFDPAEGFVMPDFRNEAEASDNCAFELIQEPPPGTRIYSGKMVFITAIDASGNESSCEFELHLVEEFTEVVEITSCAVSQVLYLTANCEAVLPDLTSEISTNISATVVQEPAPGTPISEDTTVRFTATDAHRNTDTCGVNITVEDTQAPEISCLGNQEFSFDPENGFVVPDFRSEAEATDNCNFQLLQDPAPGTTIYAGQTILISVMDNFGNESSCEFELILTEEVSEVVEISSCAISQVLDLTANCEAVLPDLTSETSTNISATVVQEPAPGTAISEDTTVRFTATDANGNTDICEVNITVGDTQVPEISCPGNQEFSFDPENGFVVPDFRSETEATDNCNFELLQDPAAGTRIYSGGMVRITAVDNFGNESFCEFELHLVEEVTEVVEITSCAISQVLYLTANCQAVLPDLTSEISTNISATVVQEPAPGTAISEDTTVRFTATDANGNIDTCEVNITVEDTQAPEISCPGDIVAVWNPEEGYPLPDFTGNISVQANCGGTAIVQEPLPGTQLLAEQEIKFTVTDASGNSAACSFWLYLSEEEEVLNISCPGDLERDLDENCGYVVEDFASLVEVNMENAIVTQDPVPGTVISNDINVTIIATFEGKQTSCSFDLDLLDRQSPEAKCVGTYSVLLNDQGVTTITAEEIDNGSTDNCGIISKSLSKTNFSIADVGENPVEFTVFDAAGNRSSCEIIILVEASEDSYIHCVEFINLELNEDRRARLDPRDLFSGGTGTVQYSIDKEEFTCADIGEQKVIFSYTTPTEEGSCEISVIVEDPGRHCELIIDEPQDPGPFVIISPNPGGGLLEVFTSADITLQRTEVYDMRGRFLLARDFSEGSSGKSYSLDLRKYQSGVYTLKLETSSGLFIRRAIIKND